MAASATCNARASLPHLMLHRNIDAGLRARAPLIAALVHRCAGGCWQVDPLWLRFLSCILSCTAKWRRALVPGRVGEDIVVGIDSIIIMLIVGAIAGWLAGQIVRGFGFGLLWNIVIGIVGAFIGVWLLTQLGFV